MLRKWLVAVVTATALNGAALAQGDVSVTHSAAFDAAVGEERFDDAINEGLSEWRAAEEALGDSPTTAVLAFDVAALIARHASVVDALEPASRAMELAQDGSAGDAVHPLDAAVIVGLAEVYEESSRATVRRLHRTLEARDDAGLADDALSMAAWLRVEADAYSRQRWVRAIETGRRARRAAVSLGPTMAAAAGNAALMEGTAALILRRYDSGLRAFEGGLNAYPDDTSVFDDPMVARLMAWRAAATVEALSSWDRSDIRARLSHADTRRLGASKPSLQACEAMPEEWESRDPPRYPGGRATRSDVGAAIVAYDFLLDGRTTNIRVLASVPSAAHGEFDDATVEAVETWRIHVPEGVPAHCLVDNVVEMQFMLR